MPSHGTVTRRGILRTVGLGVAGLTVAGNASAAEGRYIVGTRTRAARRDAQRRARKVHRTLHFGRYGSAVAAQFSEQALRGLSRRPDVDYIEADGRMYAISIEASSGTELGNSWGVDRIDAEKAHGTNTGTGAKVAILDTGIDYGHPDLGNYAGGIDYVNDDNDPMDDHGHGTHCAGIAAASGADGGVIGTAPSASLYGVKVLDSDGGGYYSDIAAGLNWTWQNGNNIDVASMSLGGGRGTTTLENACNSARDNGVFVVAAAGNDGRGRLSYPAKYDSVVAVSATNKEDNLPWWSNTGDGMDHGAPGVNVASTVPPGLGGDGEFTMDNGGTYATWSGTSMACPHVAGVAGLVMAGGMSGIDARTLLASTAEDLGAAGYDKEYGYGLVDAEAAVAASDGGGGGTTDDTTAPTAPSNLTGTATGENSVDLSWTESSDNDGGTGVAYYTVYRDGAVELETTSTSATVTGLTAGTEYSFHVTATDGAGNESGDSNTVTVTTDAASGGDSDTTSPSGTLTFVNEIESRNPHAEFRIDWTAEDAGGLSSAEIVLTDDDSQDGGVEETVSLDLSGLQSADGKVTLKAHKDDGSGHPYTVTMTVTDAAGNTGTATPISFSETGN